jgi:hypothetical protein
MSTSTSTSTSTSSSSSPCRTAMNNLRMCLESFSQPQSMMPSSIRTSTSTNFGGLTQLENLFDTTFYKTIRLDLNGRSYRRDFLLYQARCNYIRRLRVENIVMEILDYETFHYTFDIILDNGDNDDQFTTTTTTTTAAPPKLIQFHSIATVNNKNGKITKIKPMTGSAYVELFEYNINYVNDDEQQHRQQQQQQQNNNKSSSTISTKKATAIITSEQQEQQQHPLLMNTQKKRRRQQQQQQQQRKSSGIIRRVSGLFASHCRSKDFATTE